MSSPAAETGATADAGVTQGSPHEGASASPDAGTFDATTPLPDARVTPGADATVLDASSDAGALDAGGGDADTVPPPVDAARDAIAITPGTDATACTTPAAPDVCGDKCTDFSSDRDNCGTCGNACPDCWVCSNSACTVNPHPPGLCSDGDELFQGQCYPPCTSGYSSGGSICRQNCPAGWSDTNETCTKAGDPVAKATYERSGIGFTACNGGQLMAGLCYPYCRSGFTPSGTVCWGRCPAGTRDSGSSCVSGGGHYPHSDPKPHYDRGPGSPPNLCASGLQQVGSLCYPPCASGDSAHGSACWKGCPSGWSDLGAQCAPPPQVVLKNTLPRTPYGTNHCAAGH